MQQQLLTGQDRATLPDLYGTEGQGDAAVCRVRLFAPGTYWSWYVIEWATDDGDTLFGLAVGHDVELGYFSLAELAASGRVVRDGSWQPAPLGAVAHAVEAERRPEHPLPPVNPARTWRRDGGGWVCVESGTRIPAGDAADLWRASRRLAAGATGAVVFDVIRYW